LPEPLEVDLDLWDPWSPQETARRLSGSTAPWYVVGGWAVDLFLGRQTRTHRDLEIGVPAHRFAEFCGALGKMELVAIGDGRAWPVTESTLATHRQTWVREREGAPWRLDVIREQWENDVWIYRRDPRIRLRVADLVRRTVDDIPYARPEVIVLFKAKSPSEKDEADFETILPELGPDRRAWLRQALGLAHPEHQWLERLR
jgi:hypothetical protein